MDYDSFGHCVVCHRNMLIDQVIDGKVKQRLTADYGEVEYLLNDGSRMKVAMCIECRSNTAVLNTAEIMNCVKRGWEQEIDQLKWDKDRKDRYFEKHNKLEIVCPSRFMADDQIEKALEDHKNKKIKEKK